MSVAWSKAVRDLGGEAGRSVGIVAALALGLSGLFAVLSSYAILTRALNDGYRASDPPAAILHLERAEIRAIEAAASVPGVRGAEPRRTVRGRIKAKPARWRNLILFVRPDFEHSAIAKVSLERGTWPRGAGQIAIERDALQVAGAEVGDDVTIRTQSGREHSLRISGSLHDVGQAQARMENLVYGYATPAALAALGEHVEYDECLLSFGPDARRRSLVPEISRRVADVLGARGTRVTRIELPPAGEHPHAKIMGLLMASIAIFGLFILALSGVLVFNLLLALLAGQVRQIGVMKGLGGTRWRIARLYLLEAALLGAAAIVVAVPIGIAGGRWLSRTMAVFLNFDIVHFGLPFWVFAAVLAAGLFVPLVAAAIPTWRATRVPVREALAMDAPLERAFGSSPLDRALARASGGSRLLLMAIRNALRNRLRSVLTLATLTTGGLFFMAALSVRSSLVHTVDRFYATQPDLVVSLAADYGRQELERAAQGIPGLLVAEGWITSQSDLPQEKTLTVIGLPPASRIAAFDLVQGAGLARPEAAILNTALFERLGRPALGTTVNLPIDGHSQRVSVAGVTREPFMPPTAYVSREHFGARAGSANSLRLSLRETDDGVKRRLESELERTGIRILQTSTKLESRYSFDQHMLMIYVFLIIVSCILGSIGALGLFTTMSLNVMERRRELGILRAIGASSSRVARLVVGEAVAIGLFGWLLAAASVAPLTKFVGDLILRSVLRTGAEIATLLDPTGLAIWFGVSIAGSALAALLPARKTSRMSLRDSLSYE